MDDLISKQQAIEALYHVDEYNGRSVEAIRNLPPAEPKRGKWKYNRKIGTFKIFTCDQCGWNSEAEFNYCPNCGAKMEVEHD